MTVHSPPRQAAYDEGLELLGRQEAELALPRLEEALQESLAQMESCRAGCEGPEEQQSEEEEEGAGSQGGLYEIIAGKELGGSRCHREERHKLNGSRVLSKGHWIRVLQCRQRCVGDTATRPGRSFPVPDFLPSLLRQLHKAHAQGQLGKMGCWG